VGFIAAIRMDPMTMSAAPRRRVGRSRPVATIMIPVETPEMVPEMEGMSIRVPAVVAVVRQTAWK